METTMIRDADAVRTLGDLRRSVWADAPLRGRSVRDEMRANLVRKLRAGETLFPGIHGYDDTVVPQIANAILARQNLILLGLRGQAKSRILRALTSLLDDAIPVVAGSEIYDDPFAPISPMRCSFRRNDSALNTCRSPRASETSSPFPSTPNSPATPASMSSFSPSGSPRVSPPSGLPDE